MGALYKVDDVIKLSEIGLRRAHSDEESPTYGWFGVARLGGLPFEHWRGKVIDVRDKGAGVKDGQIRYDCAFFLEPEDETKKQDNRYTNVYLAEDEIEYEPSYINRVRAETEMALILERQWIEDVL